MKLDVSTTIKLRLSELDCLDPITVFLENYEPGRGKITIECFGKSWSSAWPAMGRRSVEAFFVHCNNGYLASNLSDIRDTIAASDEVICQALRKSLLELRRNGEVAKHEARDLYKRAGEVTFEGGVCSDWSLMSATWGDEWYHCLPEVPNPDYLYLCRVIDAVRDGLRQYIAQGEQHDGGEA